MNIIKSEFKILKILRILENIYLMNLKEYCARTLKTPRNIFLLLSIL